MFRVPRTEPGRPACCHEPARRGGKAHLRGLIRVRDGSGIETPNASYALQMRFPATACVASPMFNRRHGTTLELRQQGSNGERVVMRSCSAGAYCSRRAAESQIVQSGSAARLARTRNPWNRNAEPADYSILKTAIVDRINGTCMRPSSLVMRYRSFAASACACFKSGTSGSACFHRVRKSW